MIRLNSDSWSIETWTNETIHQVLEPYRSTSAHPPFMSWEISDAEWTWLCLKWPVLASLPRVEDQAEPPWPSNCWVETNAVTCVGLEQPATRTGLPRILGQTQ